MFAVVKLGFGSAKTQVLVVIKLGLNLAYVKVIVVRAPGSPNHLLLLGSYKKTIF